MSIGILLFIVSFAFLENIMLKTSTGENKIKAGLPKNTKIYHKTGSGSRTPKGLKIADNDAGYVRLPNGDLYYIAIMIKDSPLSDDENSKIISDISLTLKNVLYYLYYF